MTDHIGEDRTEIGGGHGSIGCEQSWDEKFMQRQIGPIDELFAVGGLGESGTFAPALGLGAEDANEYCGAGTDGSMCRHERSDHRQSDYSQFNGLDVHGLSLGPGSIVGLGGSLGSCSLAHEPQRWSTPLLRFLGAIRPCPCHLRILCSAQR